MRTNCGFPLDDPTLRAHLPPSWLFTVYRGPPNPGLTQLLPPPDPPRYTVGRWVILEAGPTAPDP